MTEKERAELEQLKTRQGELQKQVNALGDKVTAFEQQLAQPAAEVIPPIAMPSLEPVPLTVVEPEPAAKPTPPPVFQPVKVPMPPPIVPKPAPQPVAPPIPAVASAV